MATKNWISRMAKRAYHTSPNQFTCAPSTFDHPEVRLNMSRQTAHRE